MKARILKIVSKDYRLELEDGRIVDGMLQGKVRLQMTPAAGDFAEAVNTDGRWMIRKILPRRNHLIRPFVANVDQALIVMSVHDPEFSDVLIDRLCFLIVHAGIEPVLIVTKCDLGLDPETEERIREYENGPVRVIRTARDTLDESLKDLLSGKISVLTGQSGAGKSTLLNKLDPTFRLKTQEISKALGRGKHTTRHNELHPVAGGYVADTPGFSSLDFSRMTVEDLYSSVLEFRPYLGKCRFNDCIHENEPGCAVKEAVEQGLIPETRYRNYLAVLKMIKSRKEKYS
ncbi:MAG: ribosome small subunit-dependent GTPase A [Erysipelotrichaceae bacterium]|nr:ribosome small subunit-dependent GTPase A [Erysipelotrichaceae bacterium]